MSDNIKIESGFIEPIIYDKENKNNKSNLINPIVYEDRDKNIEEKIYIILYKIVEDDLDQEDSNIYSVCVGRTEAYSDIKNKLLSGRNIDIHRSRILTETKQTETSTGNIRYYMIPYEKAISVYSFCISVRDYYSDDPFDIEDYNIGDVPDDINDHLSEHPTYMTQEQIEYRDMLDQAMQRDRFINNLRDMVDEHGNFIKPINIDDLK